MHVRKFWWEVTSSDSIIPKNIQKAYFQSHHKFCKTNWKEKNTYNLKKVSADFIGFYTADFIALLPSLNKNYQHIFTIVFVKFTWLYLVKSVSAVEKKHSTN